jgi:predicted SnoaL-like aldol condensation-catalyzing enzyme
MLATMEDNKQIALNVLKGAFIDRDPSVVGRYFAPGCTQHNPSLPDGPGPIPAMIAGFSDTFQYEPGMAVAEGDLVMVHGRYTGWGPKPMVAVDIFRIADGRVVEHWDVDAGGGPGVGDREWEPNVCRAQRPEGCPPERA